MGLFDCGALSRSASSPTGRAARGLRYSLKNTVISSGCRMGRGFSRLWFPKPAGAANGSFRLRRTQPFGFIAHRARRKRFAVFFEKYRDLLRPRNGERLLPLAIVQKIFALFACSIFWIAALSVTPLFPPQAARRNFVTAGFDHGALCHSASSPTGRAEWLRPKKLCAVRLLDFLDCGALSQRILLLDFAVYDRGLFPGRRLYAFYCSTVSPGRQREEKSLFHS